MRVASIVHLDFLDAHGGYYTATIYIHLHYFFAIHFNSRKTLHFLCFMLKATNLFCL